MAIDRWRRVAQGKDGLYLNPFFETTLRASAAEAPCHGPGTNVEGVLELIKGAFNPVSTKTRSVIRQSTSDGEICWPASAAKPGEVVAYTRDTDGNIFRMSSVLPDERGMRSPLGILIGLVAGMAYLLGLNSVIRRVFALDWRRPAIPETPGFVKPIDRNILLLLPYGVKDPLEGGKAEEGWRPIDVARKTMSETLGSLLKEQISPETKAIALHNFEFRMHDRELSMLKLRLLERLVLEWHGYVVIASRVDPRFHLGSCGLKPELLERWAVVLGGFESHLARSGAMDTAAIAADFAARLDSDLTQPSQLR